ncbi:hypothetical protein V2J09_007966 [Rumex salicifolius]
MGSPKSDKTCNRSKDILRITCFPSESSAAQESSIFGDISNLSPVQPLKDVAVLQGFPGITSPPNVPHIQPQSSILSRQQLCHSSSSKYSQDNVDLDKNNTILDDPGSNLQLSIVVESSDHKGPVNALIGDDKMLVSPIDEEFIDSEIRENVGFSLTLESVTEKKDIIMDNCLASEMSTLLFKQTDECSIEGIVSNINQMEDESHQFVATSEVCSDVISEPFMERECRESLHEVNHIQSGVLRRCLEFGEHQMKSIGESSDDTTVRQMEASDLFENLTPETPYNSHRHVADQFEFASPTCLPSSTSAVASKPRDTFEKISSISEADLHLTESVEMTTPNEFLLPETAKPLDLPNPALEELAESSGESNQAGSNTRRKQASNSANPDGCKRCSCKKSKCLKLYCDCFAAGLYCLDSCSCQGCFNRPEHKESVVEARQLIETRNPLAFAPRIMQHVANSPTNSGANVGCSDGCRCEGCKNVHGKKPDYSVSRHIPYKRTFDETSEETPDQSHKLLITSRNHLPTDKGNDLPVTLPVTPSIPCSSDSRKNEMKSLLPGRRYVLSPDPNLNTPPSTKHQSSSRSSLVNLCHFTRLTNPPMDDPSSIASNIQEPPLPSPLQLPFCEILKSESPDCLHSSVCIDDCAMDNDTPMILRDCSAPIKSVKVSSPNKKRISPPHNHLNELLPQSFSGEMRSSRKFIFRSVPKFPPLSPCLDSSNTNEHHADAH